MRALSALLLVLSACNLDLRVEPTARVSCLENDECFDGKVCLADVGECRAPGTACIDRSGDAYRAVSAGTPCALQDGLQGVCAGGECVVSVCGDGVLDEAREACDAGGANSDVDPDICRTDCSRPRCGDGVIDASLLEVCDDGADNGPGKACSMTCTQHCGDGSQQPGEECDDGNPISGDGCDTNCTATACGNAVHSLGEGCDDGNLVSGDGCDENCRVTACGNGITTDGEVCDDGNTRSGDLCSADCKSRETCGNGITDVARQEACDLGMENSDAPDAICRSDCTYARCGDGVLDPERGEVCDGPEAMGSGTCADFAYYSGELLCGSNCQYVTAACAERCGDGVINGEELCDGAPPAGESCMDYGFDLGRLGCASYCTPGFSRCRTYSFVDRSVQHEDDLTAVWMHESGAAFAVGNRVQRWDGSAWSDIPIGAGFHYFHGVWGAAPNDVFIVGHAGEVRRWNGSSLTTMASGTTTTLTEVWGRAANDVFAVGDNGIVRHLGDDGWQPMTPVPNLKNLYAVHGLPTPGAPVYFGGAVEDTGGSGRAVIIKYESGTWSTEYTGRWAHEFYDIFVRASDDIWAVGNSNLVVRWDGVEWQEVPILVEDNFYSVHVPREDFVVAVGTFGTAYYYNGFGWTELDSETGKSLNGIDGRGDQMIVVGDDMTRLHFDGAQWTQPQTGLLVQYGSRAVWGRSPGDVWTTDGLGIFFHFDGEVWTKFDGTAIGTPSAIGGTATETWAVSGSEPYKVATITNDVWDWIDVPALAQCALQDLWVSPTGQWFVVGEVRATAEGCLARSNGGSWVIDTTPVPGAFTAVFGVSDTDVVAVAVAGKTSRFTGAGWEHGNVGVFTDVRGVWGDGTTWFAAGNDGGIWRGDGVTWTPEDSGTTQHLRALWGASATNVLAGGVAGTLLHYDGADWVTVRVPTRQDIHDIFGFAGREVFVSTGIGLPLRLIYGGSFVH